MTTIEEAKSAILTELKTSAKGLLSGKEEAVFFTEVAAMFAIEKLRYETAATPQEKEKVAGNIRILQKTIELRIARKQLRLNNTVETIAKRIAQIVVGKFFPGLCLFV
ncbi:MAG: hypothetical protein KKH28_06890 [Elusimicrobia bacterium]|nr:hypothetical protein [Elusimicrobiota bacterium]